MCECARKGSFNLYGGCSFTNEIGVLHAHGIGKKYYYKNRVKSAEVYCSFHNNKVQDASFANKTQNKRWLADFSD